jgi:osmotically-inducible protein OsmY
VAALRRADFLSPAGAVGNRNRAPAQDEDPDDLLYDRVIRKIVNDRQLKTNALKVAVEDGAVTVSGTVETEKLRVRVEKVVRKIKGVKQIDNQVRVRIRK